MEWRIALTTALAPFGLLLLLLIAWPVKRWIQRWPEGRLKRLLLFRWD